MGETAIGANMDYFLRIGRQFWINAILLIAPLWFFATSSLSVDIFGGQKLFFEASILILIGMFHFNRWIGVFLVLCGAHWFIFPTPAYHTKITEIACGALFYHFVASYYTGKGYKNVIVIILAWTIFIMGLQFFKMDILFWQNQQPSGTWTLPSYMGIFCAVVMPIVVISMPTICTFLAVLPLLMSKSVFAMAAALTGVTVILPTRKAKIVIGLFSAFVCAFYGLQDHKGGEWERRLNVWPMALSSAFRSPFIGSGLGNFNEWMIVEFRGKKAHYFQVKVKPENAEATKQEILKIAEEEGTNTDRIQNIHFKEPGAPFTNMAAIMDDLRGKAENPIHGSVWNHPHNELIMLFHEFGLLGLALLFAYLLDFVKRWLIFKGETEEIDGLFGAVVATLIVCQAHFPLHVPRLAVPIIFFFALYDAKTKNLINYKDLQDAEKVL